MSDLSQVHDTFFDCDTGSLIALYTPSSTLLYKEKST